MTTIPNTAGDDTLVGTDSDDTILAGDGSDLILASGGNDTITISGKSGSWGDTIDGGAGTDRVIIDLDGIDSLLDFTRSIYRESSENFTLTDANGNTISLTSIEEIEIGGTVYSTQVESHEGHLIDLENAVYIGMHISGDEEKGVFFTDDAAPMGSDLSYPSPPRDSNGNAITDFRVYGTDLDDIFQTVQLADGDSYVETFGGNDYLEGGRGSDTLIGGDGDDHFRVDDGGDLIRGGDGDDTVWLFIGAIGESLESDFIEVDGGTGTDLIRIRYSANSPQHLSLDSSLFESFEDIEIEVEGSNFISVQGTILDNKLSIGGDKDVFAHGGKGNDTLVGYTSEGVAILMGGDGDDVLEAVSGSVAAWGGDGDDYIHSSAHSPTLGGGAGNDTLEGSSSDSTLYGGAGDDVIRAGSEDDLIFGGNGNDIITSSRGHDTIWGGAGNDTIDLGPETGTSFDHLWFTGDHGNDMITGFDWVEDRLHVGGTAASFTSVAAVRAATVETIVDGVSGILIDTGGGNSIFVEGLTISNLTVTNLLFD